MPYCSGRRELVCSFGDATRGDASRGLDSHHLQMRTLTVGWGRTILLGATGNRLDIEDCEQDIAKLRNNLQRNASQDRSRDDEIRELRQELDQLKMCLSALSRVLMANGMIAEVDVVRFADLIDDSTPIDDNQAMRFLDDQD
jgi:hypothetical protein